MEDLDYTPPTRKAKRQRTSKYKAKKGLANSENYVVKPVGNMWGFKIKPKERDQFARTPASLYKVLNTEFNFDFDPCPVGPTFDGLSVEWGKINYVNPPYNETKKWIIKAVEEAKKGKVSVFLIPFKCCTVYWHDYIVDKPNVEIRILNKRVRYEPYKKDAPFDSVVVVFWSTKTEDNTEQ